ncbi:hypothetical protein ACLKA7_010191 [Drosophila subpalustris]
MSPYSCLIVLYIVATVNGNFPDDPKPCKYGDSECIVNIINKFMIEKAATGDPGLNLVPIEPFAIDKLSIQKGADSPISINLQLTNNYVHGLGSTRIKSVRGFGKDMTKKHEVRMFAPAISLAGPYSIKGKVLILPITGKGESNFTYANLETKLSFRGQPEERDGEIYMVPINLNADAVPGHVYFHFTNLFNGDKALGDNMNAFLNENWEPIYDEVKDELKRGLTEKLQSIVQKVFAKIPYNKLFLEN